MSEPIYRSIAVAATFSPRFLQVLAEANRVRQRFDAPLSAIFVGHRDPATSRKFSDAFQKLKIPSDSIVHYEAGDPATAILAAAGSSLSKVASATVILLEESDFAGMNEEWVKWFPLDPPARQGAKLPVRIPGMKVSIAVVAEA